MQLQHIEIEKLKVSALNMRESRKAPDIADILPSVRARGILQPLLVRPNGEAFEIVAGRRRYHCAKLIAEEQGGIAPLPCAVMEAGDDAAALEASLIENLARLDPDEMSQYETFSRLLKEGRSVAAIAATFGLSETQVRQRLALGNLLPKIRDAYRRDEIDAESLRYLTLASKAQQKEWLALYEDEVEEAPFGSSLKHWLFGGQAISTKVALFPLDQFNGQIVTDLFGEDGYFAEAEAFWQKQNEVIAERRQALLHAGWCEVVVMECGQRFQIWEHEKTPKKKGGKVFIAVSHRGDVEIHEGWLTRQEARKRHAGAEGEGTTPGTARLRPAMNKAMQNYVELHRHAVVRQALLAHPGTALRLLVAHAVASSGHWQVKAEPQLARSEDIAQSLAASAAQQGFAAARAAIRALLEQPEDHSAVVFGNGDAYGTAAVFARLLALSDEEVLQVAAFAMAETLAVGSSVVEALGAYLKLDARSHWQPDEVFFDLLRERETVQAMLAEVAGQAVADANIAATAKTQKQIIRDCLTGTNGRAKVAAWLPRWMEFPFRGYGDGVCEIAEAASTVAGLFQGA